MTHDGSPSAPPFPPHTPPPWPKTDRPLTIALIGWARLSAQGKEGSGYNLSASELARGLVLAGHRVSYLAAGMTYRLWPRGPHVAKREDWAGVSCWEIRNSPNIAPGAFNFYRVEREVASPDETALVLKWLDEVGAQVVHIHSLEGFSLDLIGAIEASGRRVVVTPHNYWYVCPQVDLLYHERQVCEDYDGGRRCVGCLPDRHAEKTKRTRAIGQSLEYLLGLYPADVVRKMIYGLKPTLTNWTRGKLIARYEQPIQNSGVLADPEAPLGFEHVAAPSPDDPAEIVHDYTLKPGEEPLPFDASPIDQNERILANRDKHLLVLNNYGTRRHAGVEALNHASMVIPPSDYLRRVHVSMGVEESRTRRVLLGQPHFDQINRRARRSPYYDKRPWENGGASATRPLRFAFLGTTRPNKGLEVLTQALPLLAPDVRRRCSFLIRAQGWDAAFRKRLSRFPEVSVWGGFDLVQLIATGGEYDVGILPHIWLENSPLVLLENLHAGKFVISSRLGGPVDWIVEPKDDQPGNGLLFAGGRPDELARCITRVVTGEATLPSAKEVHAISTLQSYPGHVRTVEGVYREVLGRERQA